MDKQFSTDDAFELTPMQRAIWAGQALHINLPVYNVAYVFEINGRLDIDCFARAHKILVDSTDSLRAVITQAKDRPKQRILKQTPGTLEILDSSSLNVEDFNKLIEEASRSSVDLEQAPWRSTLHRRSEDSYAWHFVQHHLFTDGYSFQLLIRKLAEIYGKILKSEQVAHEYTHPSFAEWTRKARHSSQANDDDEIPQLKLYSFKTPTGKAEGRRYSMPVSPELKTSLSELITKPEYQSFTGELSQTLVLLTAVFALLKRIEQKSELAIGLAGHGRFSEREKGIAGPLLNLSQMQIEVKETDTFSSLYEQVREAYFKQASELSSPDAILSEPKDSGVIFSFLAHDTVSFGQAMAKSEWIYPGCHESANLWRIHFITTKDGSLEFLSDFNEEFFSEASKRVAMDNLLTTVEAFTKDPTQAISAYTLVELNAENASVLQTPSIHISPETNLWKRFEMIAAKNVSALAVQTESGIWSYGDLKQLAENTSGMLRARAVETGDIVPIVGLRSLEMLQGALAAMRMGAAFLPIDSNQPAKRVESIITDSEARFSLFLDQPLESSAFPIPESKATKNAYLMYTSGSTGAPKGVVVGHPSVLNLVEDMERRAPLPEGSKCMWWTSVGFDVSICEIYSALLYGHALFIPPESIRLEPIKLFQWISRYEINSTYLPPFMLDPFDRWLDENPIPPLRRLIVGVEPIQEGLLQSICMKIEGLEIVNGYGPTEATVFSNFYTVPRLPRYERQAPIGDPVNGSRCYVLDADFNIVPQGAVGELYIAGDCLSLGYWKRPEVQNSLFVPDPFCGDGSQELMYKTGDLVRMNDQKQLIFIGRKDSQVKVRGHRIELGEVEQTMNLLDGIDRCAVTVREIDGQLELVCFYAGAHLISEEALVSHALAYLPFQMQARKYVHLSELPLTLNGKIDTKALSNLSLENEKAPLVAPEGAVEEHVYEIWAQVLKLESFSVHDSLYFLGGSSLAAIDITYQLNRDFEIELSQQTIFQQFTVAKLSRTIEDILFSEINDTSEEEAKRILESE